MTFKSVLKPKVRIPHAVVDHIKVDLPDGTVINVDVTRLLRSRVQPRLVVFDEQTSLLKWCKEHNVKNAINGGFTMHHEDELLGEIWSAGKQHKSVPYPDPWQKERGSVHISSGGHIKIAPRYYLPEEPEGDLLQTGPLLVHKGQSLITPDKDPEGISASSDQFDDDWTGDERYPRAVIGSNDDFIFCVAVDGYGRGRIQGVNTGLSLGELADLMIKLGATEALNLDGGSSVTLVANGKIVNKPQAGHTYNFESYPQGRPIPNAIIFEPVPYLKPNLERLYK
jgi:exopolysaccharide biosynthesis protein